MEDLIIPLILFIYTVAFIALKIISVNRKEKSLLYFGVRGSFILYVWYLIGLVLVLGPPKYYISEPYIRILALPTYLSFLIFSGHTHYMIIFAAVMGFGGVLGIIHGVIYNLVTKRNFSSKQQ